MWRFIQRINHRNATLGHLDALLMMYPRKRQFFRDFPKLKQMVREHFEKGVPSASTALIGATSIIEGFLRQLTAEEKQATAKALTASDLGELENLALRRIAGERDQPGDKTFFAARLSGVAILMAGQMVAVNAVQREEYRKLIEAVERALGVSPETIGAAFAPSTAFRGPPPPLRG
jgi:hypothetical protein